MNTRVAAIGVLCIGASVLGGVLIFSETQGPDVRVDDRPTMDPASRAGLAGASYLDDRPKEQASRAVGTSGKGSTRGGSSTGEKSGMDLWIARQAEFDTDGDGFLSELEKKAMGEALKGEWMSKHDLDGDGKMSREEWDALKRDQFESSPWGQELMRQFDSDGDGMLSEAEQQAMDAHLRELGEQKRRDELARLDTNGDGEISKQERAVEAEQRRQWWDHAVDRAKLTYDYDGDGELNIEESQDAWDAWVEYQTIAEFVRRFDSDSNGTMGPADYDAYLAHYQARDSSADVNRDGVVNSEDLSAYADLVTRSRDQ